MSFPSSTYRLQLHAGFTFRDLSDILDYLHELGISTVYASPITTAVAGSQHGYDVSTPEALNPEIGTEEELAQLSERMKQYGMSWLQDVVPNHMAFDGSNHWLWDALERGPASEYYFFFDIGAPQAASLPEHLPGLPVPSPGSKLMAPFLGDSLEGSLRNDELRLDLSDRGFIIRHYDSEYPIALTTYHMIFHAGEDAPPALLDSIRGLEQASASLVDEWKAARQQWLEQVASRPEWKSFIRLCIIAFNERPDLLEGLLNEQYYLLEHAASTADRINYRRFFTINSLICLRMEDAAVFSAYHQKIFDWQRKGYIQGFRVDHIDGLADPGEYLQRLRAVVGGDAYIVVEKILAGEESLPAHWEIQGTTGYDFLAQAAQLFTDPGGFRMLKEFHLREIASGMPSYEDLVFEKKYQFLKTHMGGELDNLCELARSLDLPGADQADRVRQKEALAILMASFRVYRLYPGIFPLPKTGRKVESQAFHTARQKGKAYAPEIDLLEQFLEDARFFTRLMQFTGPLDAKGIEDTAFYIYNPLISRNEVGDSPALDGLTASQFHAKMTTRQRILPHSLNAGSTHDTKRGEDARIRLNYLSAIPGQWIATVRKWKSLNAAVTGQTGGQPGEAQIPSANDEYFIYQSLLGAFPADLLVTDEFRSRFHDFLTKALREAKVHTYHDNPDHGYEEKCHAFVDAILDPAAPFMERFLPFAGMIIRQGMDFSLSQLLVRLTAPGIPDIYQGAECWDLSLVDPDNRSPVDFALRKYLLRRLKEEKKKGWSAVSQFITANQQAGAGKLWVITETLTYRRKFPDMFTTGEYIPLETSNEFLSYLRHDRDNWALAGVPLISGHTPQSALPRALVLPPDAPADWTNAFTGDSIRILSGRSLDIGPSLAKFPVVLLTARS